MGDFVSDTFGGLSEVFGFNIFGGSKGGFGSIDPLAYAGIKGEKALWDYGDKHGIDNWAASIISSAFGMPYLGAAYNAAEASRRGNDTAALLALAGGAYGAYTDYAGAASGLTAEQSMELFGTTDFAGAIPYSDADISAALASKPQDSSWGSPEWMAAQDNYYFGPGTSETTLAGLKDVGSSITTPLSELGFDKLGFDPTNYTYNPEGASFGELIEGIDTSGKIASNLGTATEDLSNNWQQVSKGLSGQNQGLDSTLNQISPSMTPTGEIGYNPDQYGDLARDPTWAGSPKATLEDVGIENSDAYNAINNPDKYQPWTYKDQADVNEIGLVNKLKGGMKLQQKGGGMDNFQAGLKGLGSLDSYLRNKKAMQSYEGYLNSMRANADANAARGTIANQLWTDNYTNPQAGFNQFMAGEGQQFLNQARAQAAKSGRRGSYINSGKMQSDLASLYMQKQNERARALQGGFSDGSYSGIGAAMPGYASMIRNQNAPIFDALGNIAKSNPDLLRSGWESLSSLWN